ncbi:uncharacterized protein EDB91DRAFT_1158123 [Suillus paluster]|uniref:uncharacterized protein n=1 Tax=Suillus paluster TaxID=48578 RepID=UPI001B880CAA|nr:uncharacterized protein EDB91DRAFT_1158123 [Suillus paluster]KAG1730152.1 hypothetical protein EDB91DRAFT_1158123 [Suillus paluster]
MEEESDPDEYDGWLTLTYDGDSKLEADTLNNIHGSASFGNITGSFKGLAVKHQVSRHGKGDKIPNCWALCMSTLRKDAKPVDKIEQITSDEAHMLTALEVRDDNGHPFVEFSYELGWSGCSPWYLVYIGKKQVDESHPKGLSDAEMSRLGMDMDAEEVEIAVNGDGSDEEDGEENSEESDEESGEDAPVPSHPSGSSIAGAMKRKAEEDGEGDGIQRPSVKAKRAHH